MRRLQAAILAGLAAALACPAHAAAPPGWSLRCDPRDGAVRLGTGRFPATATPGEAPAAIAARFLDAHAGWIGVPAAALLPEAPRVAGRLQILRYRQFAAGCPVEGATVDLVFSPGGDLIAFVSRAVADVAPASGGPALDREAACALALQELGVSDARGIVWWEARRVICPRRLSEGDEDRSAWRLGLRTLDPAGAWRILIDDRDGTVLLRRSLVVSAAEADFRGEMRGRLRTPTPFRPPRTVPFPDAAVTALDGDVALASGFGDSLGRFDLGEAAAAAPRVRAELAGRFARVHRAVLDAEPRTLTVDASTESTAVFWDSTRATPAELEAYVHLNTAHARLRSHGITLPGLEVPIPLVVSDSTLGCNALTYVVPDAPWIRFSAANGGCSEMARLADVVAHEYTHLIALYAYQPDEVPDSLVEGFADFFAASLGDTSRVGLDWHGPGTWLRDLVHERRYPVSPACRTSSYCVGGLIGGALWDLRAALIAAETDAPAAIHLAEQLFLDMLLARPDDFATCLLYLRLLDDDDADLTNGTPHLDAIAGAFERHGLGDFAVDLRHTPLVDADPGEEARQVTVTASAIYPIEADGVHLHHHIDDGGFQVEVLAGDGTTFHGALPAGPTGVTVRYYFTASDRAGHTAVLPAGAPSACFTYRIGPDATPPRITHHAPEALAAGATGVWIAARVLDERGPLDAALVDAARERAGASEPATWVLMPKAPEAPALDGLLEACAGVGELHAGDRVRYRIRAHDTPDSNAACYPSTGEIAVPVVRGASWDFESEPAGFALEGEWAWCGLPLESLTRATRIPSGARCVGLAPAAPVATRQILRLPEVDLTGGAPARLEGLLHYRASGVSAGARVEASADGGASWSPVRPLGGYPGAIWIDTNGDGYYDDAIAAWTGASAAWERFVVPLDAFLPGPILTRIVVWTDPYSDSQAWYLDDLGVLEAPARAAPEALSASQGEDARVSLAWLPPPDAEADLRGYRIYRGALAGDYAFDAPAADSITETRWVDTAVENGAAYHYAVAALWPEGAGPLSEDARGAPYHATWSGPADAEVITDAPGTAQDTLWIENQGTGSLAVAFLVADEGETLEDRRPVGTVPAPSPGFTLLASDPADAEAADLRSLAYRTVSGNLILRVGLHGPLPDPRARATVRIFIDTDLSPATGIAEDGLGAEYVIVLGRWIYEQTDGGALAYVLDEHLAYVTTPSYLFLHAGFDSLEVAVPLHRIGSPARFACAVRADEDHLPDPPLTRWLSFSPRGGTAEPGAPLPLALTYDVRGLAGVEHRAQLLVLTNDPADPERAIPITVRTGAPGVIEALRLEAPYPNPMRAGTTLRLLVPAGIGWSADILDVTGRAVRHLARSAAGTAGLQILHWDGRRDDATRVDSGVYYGSVRGGGARTTRTILVVR